MDEAVAKLRRSGTLGRSIERKQRQLDQFRMSGHGDMRGAFSPPFNHGHGGMQNQWPGYGANHRMGGHGERAVWGFFALETRIVGVDPHPQSKEQVWRLVGALGPWSAWGGATVANSVDQNLSLRHQLKWTGGGYRGAIVDGAARNACVPCF